MNLNKIFKSVKHFTRSYWQRWTILAILGMIIYLGFIGYKYVYRPIYTPEKVAIQKLEIKEMLYRSLIDGFAQKQDNLVEIFNKNYINPFK